MALRTIVQVTLWSPHIQTPPRLLRPPSGLQSLRGLLPLQVASGSYLSRGASPCGAHSERATVCLGQWVPRVYRFVPQIGGHRRGVVLHAFTATSGLAIP